MKPELSQNTYARFLLPDLAKEYFNARREKIFGGRRAPAIRHVDIWPLRTDHKARERSFVAIYDLYQNTKQRHRIVGLAHEGGAREAEHRVVETLSGHMDSLPALQVPRPVFYDKRFGVSFISHIPGPVLNDTLGREGRFARPVLASAIHWIKALQSIPVRDVPLPYAQPSFVEFRKNLRVAERVAPEFAPKLVNAWQRWHTQYRQRRRSMRPVLAHGDFHPWNIKVLPDTQQVAVYDFGLLTKAPRYWDLASFIAQIESINSPWLSQEQLRSISEDILETWGEVVSPLTAQDTEELFWLKRYFDLSAIVFWITWGEPWKEYGRIVSLYEQL